MNTLPFLRNHLYFAIYNAIIKLQKKSTHSKVDAPKKGLDVFTDTAYPVCRQDRHFYFRLFLLSRKASNAINILPKDISKANTPIKTEIISNAVICATVFAPLRSLLSRCHWHLATFLCISAKPIS